MTTIEITDAMIERAADAIDLAWHSAEPAAMDLPPIEFTPDERLHLARAALRAALSTPEER